MTNFLEHGRVFKYDRWIETIVLILMAMGTVFVFSAGASVTSKNYSLSEFYAFTTLKQLVFFPAAVVVMYLVSLVDYRTYNLKRGGIFRTFSPYLLAFCVILLCYVLFFGVERNESRRWIFINLPGLNLSFQPSELAKWAIIIFVAGYQATFSESMDSLKRFGILCGIVGLVVGLIIVEDFGTAFFISMITLLLLVAGAVKWWHILLPLPVVVPLMTAAIVMSPTRVNRLLSFANPDKMYLQARHSLYAIGTGGLWGKGLGKGVLKYGHVPEDTTDFIFAIIAEEMGFVSCVAVIGMFALFAFCGLRIARKCGDPFGKLLALGITCSIAIQAAINIGVVTVVLPTKGIPLPFVSAGGTSLILTAAAVGVLLNIGRQSGQME